MNEVHIIFNLHSKTVGVKVNISYDLRMFAIMRLYEFQSLLYAIGENLWLNSNLGNYLVILLGLS